MNINTLVLKIIYLFFKINVSKKKSLDNFKDADYLIHCASMTNAEKSFGKEKEMYKRALNHAESYKFLQKK